MKRNPHIDQLWQKHKILWKGEDLWISQRKKDNICSEDRETDSGGSRTNVWAWGKWTVHTDSCIRAAPWGMRLKYLSQMNKKQLTTDRPTQKYFCRYAPAENK